MLLCQSIINNEPLTNGLKIKICELHIDSDDYSEKFLVKKKSFSTTDSHYSMYNNSRFHIMGICNEDTIDVDVKNVIYMFKIKFEDGKIIEAFPDEIFN